MGCLKLPYQQEKKPLLKCAWNSGEQQKSCVRMYDYGLRYYDPQLGRFISIDPMSESYYSWSPYNYVGGNPIKRTDTDGAYWDLAIEAVSITMGVTSMIDNIKQGNGWAAVADGAGVIVDAALTIVPFVPGGTGMLIQSARAGDKAIDAMQAVDKAKDVVKTMDNAKDVKKAATMTENAKNGKAFEKTVGGTLDGAKAEQVTIEAADGTRTRVDFAQNKGGEVSLTEAKGSAKAPLTKNQKSAHPQIEQSGGTIKGNKGQDIGLPAGTKIPPTKVNVVRPDDIVQ